MDGSCYHVGSMMDSESRFRARPIPERFTRPVLLAGFQRELVNIRSAADPDKAREEWMSRTRAKADDIFLGHEDLVSPVLERMDAMLRADDDAFSQTSADLLAGVFEELYRDPEAAERFHAHLREEERKDREHIVREADGTPLSPERMLYGKLDDDDGGTFRLHVAVAFTLEPGEQIVDFRKGMRELARLLQEDPAFQNVKMIVGTSWLVGEHPRLAKQLGFTVADGPLPSESAAHFGGETRKVQQSWMTREELIAKYGTPRTISVSNHLKT